MLKKLKLLLICCFALTIFALPSAVQAKNSVVENISSAVLRDESGSSYLHVEIGTNREPEDFSANINPNMQKQVIFRIKDSRIDHIARQSALDGELGDKIFLQELSGYVQGKLYFNSELTNENIKTYTVTKKNSQFGYKHGAAIDIYPGSAVNSNTQSPNVKPVGSVKGRIIAIDPGHGGSDTGAIGPSGFTEKEATLAISRDLEAILNKSGAKTVMTRTTDVDVYGPNASATNELQARADIANRAGADIFVSIHCNAFTNPAAHGTETFYYGGSYSGRRLAGDIQQEIVDFSGLYSRGISTANFYVLKHSDMPAVLVETAFISNYDEEALLSDPEWQQGLAEAIARGISSYFG